MLRALPTRVVSPLTCLYAFLLQLNVTPFKYKVRRPWPSEAQVRLTPPDAGQKVLKPKRLLQSPLGAPLVAPDPESIGTIAGQLVHVSKEDVVDKVHVGDVAKYSFFYQVTLQARVKEDSGAVTSAKPMMVCFPMWMKGHAVGRDRAAVFIGGTLYQIKGDSHSYVQTWRVHGGQLKQAKRVQWSGVAGYLPITDAAVVAEVDGALERWKLLLAGKVGGKRDTGTGGGHVSDDNLKARFWETQYGFWDTLRREKATYGRQCLQWHPVVQGKCKEGLGWVRWYPTHEFSMKNDKFPTKKKPTCTC